MAAFLLPAHVGPRGYMQLAAEFAETGHMREAMRCWRIVHGMAPADGRIFRERVSLALRAGDVKEVEHAVRGLADGIGMPPQHVIRLAGQLAEHGYLEAAGRMLSRLADATGVSRHIAQSSSIFSTGIPADVRALADAILAADADPGRLLPLARLCFTFHNPRVAAQLFARASASQRLDPLDRAAMLHALAKADPGALTGVGPELRALMATLCGNHDALGMLMKAALVAGEKDTAHEAMRLALRLCYGNCEDGLLDDCAAILNLLQALRRVDATLPPALLERTEPGEGGVAKVFLCGFGWSGSGALYDEIRGVRGFCEFEGAGLDAAINEDADSEVMFVQGPGGLGELWLRAIERKRISWHVLWNMFSLHVAGLSPIGYSQYKSSAAARNQVRRYGAEYVRPFRRFLEEYAALRKNPRPGGLQACLLETTESLCAMLMRRSGARAVLFNNAIFARNAEMLEVFSSRRVAIVYRDPRDVYVDRRAHDMNHWRTPAQLAAFYAHSLHKYTEYKARCSAGAVDLREVPFEKFVENDAFRARVRAWLLGTLAEESSASCFDPKMSRGNIGIHAGELTPAEQVKLQGALDDCRILDHLSEVAWGQER